MKRKGETIPFSLLEGMPQLAKSIKWPYSKLNYLHPLKGPRLKPPEPDNFLGETYSSQHITKIADNGHQVLRGMAVMVQFKSQRRELNGAGLRRPSLLCSEYFPGP